MKATRVVLLLAVGLALSAAAPSPADESTPVEVKKPVPRPISTIGDDGDSPWFSFPVLGNLFAPLWQLFPSFEDIGPRIVGDENKFQVVIRVQDFSKDEIKVKVKSGLLFVQGSHESTGHSYDIFANQFFHTYTLPANCSAADVTAELSNDGYLIVTAPLGAPADRTTEPDREVPITETGAPYKPPKEEKPAITESGEDSREPTTPVTTSADEKENKIEHGNEVLPL